MSDQTDICPACGRPFSKNSAKMLHYVLGGAVAGLVVGTAFVAWWFGTYAGFFHTMAVIHEVAGTVLGALAGLIVWNRRK